MRPAKRIRALTSAVLLLALANCAVGESLDHQRAADEIPSGPGLLSGDDGEFVIYRR